MATAQSSPTRPSRNWPTSPSRPRPPPPSSGSNHASAMLSYSTGESGTGADVDKVRAATELVKARCPELPVDGPIQYDAAVDASVGRGETARVGCRRPRDRVHLPRPQHRQQHLQGCPALVGRSRDRPGPAGPATSRSTTSPVARRSATSSTPSPSPRSRRRRSRPARVAAGRRGGYPSVSANVLVLNSGSSSIKYELVDPLDGARLASGVVERIGEERGPHRAYLTTGRRRSVTSRSLRIMRRCERCSHCSTSSVHGCPTPTSWRSATGSCMGGEQFAGAVLIDAEVSPRSTGWRRSPRSTTPPTSPASASPASCFLTFLTSPCSTPPSSTTCRWPPPPTRSIDGLPRNTPCVVTEPRYVAPVRVAPGR